LEIAMETITESETGSNTPLCEVSGVGKKYPLGETWVQALQGVNLTVKKGEFLALSGPSGSGKTTLLNLIGALDTPTEGEVSLLGQKLSGLSGAQLADVRSKRIGFIFQSFNLIPVLTALENVEVALRLAGEPPDRARCEESLRSVGLGDFLNRRPSQLSGGQQQRVAIARALVKRPDIVIADEPTANLDSKTGAEVLDLMRDLNEKNGSTFIFSTHDHMVLERASRIVTLRDGVVTGEKIN
jgi:putative ABC transport system ATP-binding protein